MGFTASAIGSVVGYEKATNTTGSLENSKAGKGVKKQAAQIAGIDTTAHAMNLPPLPRPRGGGTPAPVDAREKQRRQRIQYFQGQNGTILTGALGLVNEPTGPRKTLLGS